MCQSVRNSQESDFAPEPELSKARPCTFHAMHKRPVHSVKIPTPTFPFQASDISGGVAAAPLSQSQTRCAPRSTLELPEALFVSGTKLGFGWGARGVRAGRRGGSVAQVTKHFFKATLLLCNNLLLPPFFSLSLANKLPGKAQDSPINNETGGKREKNPAAG